MRHPVRLSGRQGVPGGFQPLHRAGRRASHPDQLPELSHPRGLAAGRHLSTAAALGPVPAQGHRAGSGLLAVLPDNSPVFNGLMRVDFQWALSDRALVTASPVTTPPK
jgi:hypothetical protein